MISNDMIGKFLTWKLPKNFNPDAGISFTPSKNEGEHWWPTGTNLFTAEQAKTMLEHVVGGRLTELESIGALTESDKDKRIAALEVVAEAAVKTVFDSDEDDAQELEDALRASGYLKEKGNE